MPLDWTNNAEARHHSPDRSAGGGGNSKIGDIQHKIAKNTVCKKYKVILFKQYTYTMQLQVSMIISKNNLLLLINEGIYYRY